VAPELALTVGGTEIYRAVPGFEAQIIDLTLNKRLQKQENKMGLNMALNNSTNTPKDDFVSKTEFYSKCFPASFETVQFRVVWLPACIRLR
jgi:hypothetical protein